MNIKIQDTTSFKNKKLLFSIQKIIIIIFVFVFMFLSIFDAKIPFIADSGSLNSIIRFLWSFFLMCLVGVVAWPIAKFGDNSYTKIYIPSILIVGFIVYGVLMIVFLKPMFKTFEQMVNNHTFDLKILYWILPPLVVPSITKLIDIFSLWNVSPFQARHEIFRFVQISCKQAFLFLAILFSIYLWLFKIKFSLDIFLYRAIVSSVVPIFFLYIFITLFLYFETNKIKFRLNDSSFGEIVLIPMYVSLSIWFILDGFAIGTPNSLTIIFIVLVTIVPIISIVYRVVSRAEFASSLVSHTFYAGGLSIIWMLVFIQSLQNSIFEQSFRLLLIFAIFSSCVMFVIITFTNKGLKKFHLMNFNVLTRGMTGALIIFFLLSTQSGVEEILPMSLPTLVVTLLVLPPIAYLLTNLIKLMYTYFLISRKVNSEIRVLKKRAKNETK